MDLMFCPQIHPPPGSIVVWVLVVSVGTVFSVIGRLQLSINGITRRVMSILTTLFSRFGQCYVTYKL